MIGEGEKEGVFNAYLYIICYCCLLALYYLQQFDTGSFARNDINTLKMIQRNIQAFKLVQILIKEKLMSEVGSNNSLRDTVFNSYDERPSTIV